LDITEDTITWKDENGKQRVDLIFTWDHIIPKCKGGDNSKKNKVPSCGPCNREKGERVALQLEDGKYVFAEIF